jgi:hypothetical protein
MEASQVSELEPSRKPRVVTLIHGGHQAKAKILPDIVAACCMHYCQGS